MLKGGPTSTCHQTKARSGNAARGLSHATILRYFNLAGANIVTDGRQPRERDSCKRLHVLAFELKIFQPAIEDEMQETEGNPELGIRDDSGKIDGIRYYELALNRLNGQEADARHRQVGARSRLQALRKLCRLFILGAAATPSIFTRPSFTGNPKAKSAGSLTG